MNTTHSAEHLLYLKKRRNERNQTVFFRFLVLFLLLFIWEALAAFSIVNPFITSSPSRILRCIADMLANGELLYHTGVTLAETLIGFAISVGVGYALALLLWWSDRLRKICEPYLVVLNALPKIALGPLIIVWFGTGYFAIVFMTVLVGVIVALMNLLTAFSATEEGKILLLRSMGASKRQILQKLVVPASYPALLNTLKICVGLSWIGSIMGEYIVSRAGLGYLIVYGGQVFKLDLVMSAVIVLCLLAAGMYALIALFDRLYRKHR